MRSSLAFALALTAAASLSACSGSEKAPADPPAATAEAAPTPAAPTVGKAPSFDDIPVDQPAPASPSAPPATPEPQPEPVGFRVPADAIGGANMGNATFDIATRGETALKKHFTDAGVDPSSFYFKIPVEQRNGYWTMTFFGVPASHPDGLYVEVKVYPDGSAEVMR